MNTDSLAEQTLELLRSWIVTLRLASGERIRIAELQEYLGVSGAPIRDALHRLAQEKLVEVRPRVGYFVRKLSPDEIRDIWSTRQLFETYAMRTGFDRLPRQEIERLHADSLRISRSVRLDSESVELLEGIDATFHHSVLMGSCDNGYVVAFYDSVYNLIALTRHLCERYRDDIREHLRIFEAIKTGDREEALLALELHLRAAESALLDNYR